MSGEKVGGAAEEREVGDDFDDDIDQRADPATNDDDPEPVHVRASADEVDQRDDGEDPAVRIAEETEHERSGGILQQELTADKKGSKKGDAKAQANARAK